MASQTLEILKNLAPGMEARLYADSMTLQIVKLGLSAFALLCFLVAAYLLLKQLGNFIKGQGRKSVFAFLGMIFAGVAAYLLFDKAASFEVLNDEKPVINITPQALEYDVRKSGWSTTWRDIDTIELSQKTIRKKQSMPETSYEIRVHIKDERPVQWKYEPSPENDMAGVKSTFDQTRFLLVNPEFLGVAPEVLQKALEKYRAGS